MEYIQINSIIDAIKTGSELECWQALSIINNLGLELLPRSKEDYFRYVGNLKNLDIEVRYKLKQYYLIARGSLPKYFRGENASELTWSELELVKEDINHQLHIDAVLLFPSKFIPVSQLDFFSFSLSKVEFKADIEIGVDLPFMGRFLETNLIQHKGEPFRCNDGLTYKCKHEHYILKVYPKGENVLRFELILLTRELKRYKLFKPNDLIKEKLKPVAERMKLEFSEIVFGDGINLFTSDDITKEEELALLKLTNTWRNNCYNDTLQTSSKKEAYRYKQRMYRLKKKCQKIFNEKGGGIKKELVDSLNLKIDSCFL